MSESPQIVTFYSYKGGVGRSMAVLNVAYAMAGRGLNVLVLDLDLEAPGLSGFLHRNQELGTQAPYDIVDLLRWASEVARSTEPIDQAALPPASDYIVSVPLEKFCREPEFGGLGRLDFIPVDEARDYYSRMTALGIGNLDRDALIRIGSVLRTWLKSRRFTANVPDYYCTAAPTPHYDFILVDSRTGVTEIGGLCIGPLSDNLVVLTALNDQNINGTKQFLEEVGVLDATGTAGRLDPKPTLIVASPVPAGEIETKNKRLESLKKVIGKIDVKLSYHPQLALFETIFVRDYQDEYLAAEYFQLVELVRKFAHKSFVFDLFQFREIPKEKQRQRFRELLHSFSSYPENELGTIIHFLARSNLMTFEKADIDFALIDNGYRYCSQSNSLTAIDWTMKRAELILEWASKTVDKEVKRIRYTAAQHEYSLVLDSARTTKDQKKAVFISLGNSLLAQTEQKTGVEADRLSALAIEKYEAALRITPDMHQVLYNLGTALSVQAIQKTGDEADRLFALAFEKYEKALQINPEKHEAYGNWGQALIDQAKKQTAVDAESTYALAIEKLLRAEAIAPGVGSYNLACLNAIQGNEADCREWLMKALEHGRLPSKQHMLEDSDLERVRDLDWFQELISKSD